MKTSELKDLALDWAAAKAMGVDVELNHGEVVAWKTVAFEEYRLVWKPSTSWTQGGAIIEREKISLWARGNEWAAESFVLNEQGREETGETPLIAAMRCFVASKLGNEVDLPDEFKQGESNEDGKAGLLRG